MLPHPLLRPGATAAATRTLNIAVGSKNPCKVEAVEAAFASILSSTDPTKTITLNVTGFSAPSLVSDQPMTDSETLLGAKNRASAAANILPNCDFAVGLEGGIVDDEDGIMWCMAWMVVLCPSEVLETRRWGIAKTGAFPLPPLMAALVRKGVELGIADDIVTKREDSKLGGGTVGVLTNEIVSRGKYYEHAIVLAMTKFIQEEVFFKGCEGGIELSDDVVKSFLEGHVK
ncbi:hypothetical protein TrLO_g3330 [Triparma laevis f. longispina]|uniref:inosine/xanthosine triphosphatase n=1 Tax=Triparma laevis f. longispina TaxID=1714387 RepID=A0A9W7FNH4_9STRA|nr:hypothetical protein TrLO_g3330 [Triparma laevis f. longispina]